MAGTSSKHVLLVEGEGDRGVFEQICNSLQLNPEIQVATPKDNQGPRNGKPGVFERLPILLKRIADGELVHLAVVVDADYVQYNEGYQKTLEKITEIITPYGFSLTQRLENQPSGLIFENSDGLADLGLWIMPNNQNEGMLEDFIKTCLSTTELPLFDHAVQVVQAVPNKKFKDHHYSKAEVATWLAWQNQPGHGLYYSVKDKLLDTEHALFQEMQQWLKNIFTQTHPQ